MITYNNVHGLCLRKAITEKVAFMKNGSRERKEFHLKKKYTPCGNERLFERAALITGTAVSFMLLEFSMTIEG